eukprot:TRINITY_DN23455_c0_g1_i1.p1 TRINITY_DN23455_c0_g1~~TRINITY_DN23455_c0_g1_i1.p1  ORF type:complete len:197 (-),score=26.87 TRINITY_DN23455_c0_g1_i1:36-626(-)
MRSNGSKEASTNERRKDNLNYRRFELAAAAMLGSDSEEETSFKAGNHGLSSTEVKQTAHRLAAVISDVREGEKDARTATATTAARTIAPSSTHVCSRSAVGHDRADGAATSSTGRRVGPASSVVIDNGSSDESDGDEISDDGIFSKRTHRALAELEERLAKASAMSAEKLEPLVRSRSSKSERGSKEEHRFLDALD